MAPPPRFIVHSLAHAEAALRAARERGVPIILESPRDAARFWGAPYFLALIAQAHAAVPEARFEAVLDCGTAPGLAMEALRRGVRIVRLRDSNEMMARVADMAHRVGARLEPGPCPDGAHDLDQSRDPGEAARRFLVEGRP